MLKKLVAVIVVSFVVVGLLAFGTPEQKAYAGGVDNLKRSSAGLFAGWTEIAIYPVQQAAKPGIFSKILFPVNIVGGAAKAATRTGFGVLDFITFFKGKNIVNSYPGEEL